MYCSALYERDWTQCIIYLTSSFAEVVGKKALMFKVSVIIGQLRYPRPWNEIEMQLYI